jgi:hypothetical protein
MSQGTLFIANSSGAAVRSAINNALTRLSTRASGTGRPVDIGVFEEWIETDNPGGAMASVWQWDGTTDVLRGIINTSTHTFTPFMPTQFLGTQDNTGASTAFVQQAINNVQLFGVGDMKPTLRNAPDPGWMMYQDGTIGGVGSGASLRAQSDTQALFSLLWGLSNGDAVAPLNTSRGANAAADFAAGKTIRLPLFSGRNIGNAGQGLNLTNRTLGSNAGAEAASHSLTISETPWTFGNQTPSTGGGNVQGVNPQTAVPFTIPTIPPTTYFNWMVHL